MDWKETLAAVAPAIATALGGPFAGVALSIASDKLGLSDATEDALQNAVTGGNSETLLKLKEADKAYDLAIKKLDVQDRESARGLAKEKGIWLQAGLTILFCALFGTLLWQIFTGEEVVHQTMRDIANFLLGTLTGILIQQMNFWFGSSEGSKRKGIEMGKGK